VGVCVCVCERLYDAWGKERVHINTHKRKRVCRCESMLCKYVCMHMCVCVYEKTEIQQYVVEDVGKQKE